MASLKCIPKLKPTSSKRWTKHVSVLQLECLESREVLYGVSGNLWPHPELVTLSFQPDGTNLGGPSSNLFAEFNSDFGSTSAWQNPILKAAQAWAQQTNLNFAVVTDNGEASGGGSYQQGDANFGDIRFGGFNFNNSNLLALAYMPPEVNNYSIAGDIGINTGQIFNINGGDYDLYTVMLHELGHTLGLDHSSSPAAILYSSYEGVETGLNSDDIAGIRAIYGGARVADSYDAAAANGNFASATEVTTAIESETLTAQIPNLDITATNDLDFYKFTVPEGGIGTMTVTVQSRGLSLLAPSLKIYNGSQTHIGAATGSGYIGSTLTSTVNVTAGQTYYVRVAGANATAFGTGAYGITLRFGTETVSAIPSPNTQTANGDPLNGGGGVANRRDENGISVASLLIQTDRLVNRLTGGGLLGRLVSRLIERAVELPFVDGLEINPNLGAEVDVPVPVLPGGPISASPLPTTPFEQTPFRFVFPQSTPSALPAARDTSFVSQTWTAAMRAEESAPETTGSAERPHAIQQPVITPNAESPVKPIAPSLDHVTIRQPESTGQARDAYFSELSRVMESQDDDSYAGSAVHLASLALALGLLGQPQPRGNRNDRKAVRLA